MITAYRICKTIHADSAFSGEGARRYGGRWNQVGTKMVYVAGSLSLATLELLVHIEDRNLIESSFSVAEVRFDESLVKHVKLVELPEKWNESKVKFSTQRYGSDWVKNGESVVLAMPSVVTPGEVNYLLNVEHQDFDQIEIGKMRSFKMDRRLI